MTTTTTATTHTQQHRHTTTTNKKTKNKKEKNYAGAKKDVSMHIVIFTWSVSHTYRITSTRIFFLAQVTVEGWGRGGVGCSGRVCRGRLIKRFKFPDNLPPHTRPLSRCLCLSLTSLCPLRSLSVPLPPPPPHPPRTLLRYLWDIALFTQLKNKLKNIGFLFHCTRAACNTTLSLPF